MGKENFKSDLKVDNVSGAVNISDGSDNTEKLLKALGLFPLPENVDVFISDDQKYLNFRLKDDNHPANLQHLLFQLPLVAQDLSALNSSNEREELLYRYNKYTNEYIDIIKQYALKERKYLQEKFPGLVFTVKIRIKSYESYLDKINKLLKSGLNPYINDIMAERIIVTEYNGSQNEQELIDMCYKVAQALYDFRIDTNFRMQEDVEINTAKTDKEYITKDYIAHPKDNNYQSIHLLMYDKTNNDLTYETQIRTLTMENDLKKGKDETTKGENDEPIKKTKLAHTEYKPRVLNDLSATRVPLYIIITQFDDEYGNPIILKADFDSRFYHYYNESLNVNEEKTIPMTYENYKKELAEITSSLGIPLKSIREKLKQLDISKFIKQTSPDGR